MEWLALELEYDANGDHALANAMTLFSFYYNGLATLLSAPPFPLTLTPHTTQLSERRWRSIATRLWRRRRGAPENKSTRLGWQGTTRERERGIESLLRCHRDYHRSQSCHGASAEFQFCRPNLARDLRKVNHSPTAMPDELTEVS